MNHKISIIIPAYNLEKCLSATLKSVIAQTYKNIEIIVVDDGSKDGTGSIIDTYAKQDCRIKAIYKENGGVTSARLRGITEATGEWVGFVDGDDFVEPSMFARLLENALEYKADISHCGYQMVFPDGHIDYYYNTGRVVRQVGLQGCFDLLDGTFVEPGLCNKLYRRELLEGLSEWMDQSIKINEDLLMNYYLFHRTHISVFEDICPYHYVLRKGSAATSVLNVNKLRDPLKVTHLILKDASEELLPAVIQKLTRQLITYATMPLSKQRELIAPYRRETRRELRQRLWSILIGSECNFQLKIMALWAAIFPSRALIVGTPVCTVEVSGMKEMLGDHNEWGIVTENDDEALYQGIKRLIDDPALLSYYKEKPHNAAKHSAQKIRLGR